LQKLPVDVLKIDRSFITPLDESTERGELVAAIIHIAHTMRKRIVAEGVETVEQLNKLKEFGCDLVQGYFIARPLPAVELEQFL
jgi:EAL domain-containing protein (putative c-di-GMP-specific phosphodiesterase class I)